MSKYKSYLYPMKAKGNRAWRGSLSETIPNPDYLPKPDGEDTRTSTQKKKSIQKQLNKTFLDMSKAEANKALAEWHEQMEREAGFGENAKLTVADYVDYYVNIKSANIETSTIKGYKDLNKIIRVEFANTPLTDLTGAQINAWTHKLNKSGKSQCTVQKCYKHLKAAYDYAVQVEDIDKSPFKHATPPKAPETAPNPLTDASYKRLVNYLDMIQNTPLKLACILGLRCGMRIGEICALRWSDFDTRNNLLNVQRSIGRGSGDKATYIKKPKTKASNRVLPLHGEALDMLNEYYMSLKANLALLGVDATEEQLGEYFIVGDISGKHANPVTLSREYTSISRSLNLVGVEDKLTTFHDLRDTFATVAIAEHVDVKSVQSHMGHADATVTLNKYAGVDTNAKRAAAQQIADAFEQRKR